MPFAEVTDPTPSVMANVVLAFPVAFVALAGAVTVALSAGNVFESEAFLDADSTMIVRTTVEPVR